MVRDGWGGALAGYRPPPCCGFGNKVSGLEDGAQRVLEGWGKRFRRQMAGVSGLHQQRVGVSGLENGSQRVSGAWLGVKPRQKKPPQLNSMTVTGQGSGFGWGWGFGFWV